MRALIQRVVLVLLSVMFVATAANAQMRIDVTKGVVEPMPIALPDFVPIEPATTAAGSLADVGALMSGVITNNLEGTGLFASLDHNAFIATMGSDEIRPNFVTHWRPLGVQAMVSGRLKLLSDGYIQVEFRLWDVLSESLMLASSYRTPAGNWRRIAHVISDKIYTRMTGEDGYFDTRIVYIAETGDPLNRVKRLAIMDQDGENQRFLTSGDYMVLTPRFSPSQQEITYLSYFNGKPRVYLFNISTNQFEILGDFEKNMTFAPRFSPDGNKVIMSLSEDGNSDIYVMDLPTRKLTRLTSHPGIDTSPSFAPSGEKIVFNSDRGGSQQLYVMDADGSNIERISFGSGRYATPVWSPRGDLIAFTKLGEGKFRIGVMRPDGSGERVLTDAYQDEGPTWSPNGRVLMFFRTTRYDNEGNGGDSSIWSVDLTGYNERKVTTPFNASDPAWSPPLQVRRAN